MPGAQYDKFKGDFLAKVRTRELCNALSIHGIPPENIEWLGFIDGLVYFTKDLIEKFRIYLEKEKPDVIFAPEPIYTWYYHMDHINTGRAVFYIIHKKLVDFTPNIYFYNTISPNFLFPFNQDEYDLAERLLACHKTQYWLINNMKLMYVPIIRYYGMKLRGWKYAESYRRVFLKEENKKKNKPSFLVRVFSHYFNSLPFFQAKYPQDVLKELKEKKQNL